MIFFSNTGTRLSTVLKARPGSDHYPKKILLAIIFLGLLCRIFISFFTSLPNIHTDSVDYFHQADAILKGGYINFFPNGYPFIIAVIKTCFGTAAITILLLLNVVMSVLNIYFAYDIAKNIFRQERMALVAAFIVAFFPSQINYVRWLMTEVPTSFFSVRRVFFLLQQKILGIWFISGACDFSTY